MIPGLFPSLRVRLETGMKSPSSRSLGSAAKETDRETGRTWVTIFWITSQTEIAVEEQSVTRGGRRRPSLRSVVSIKSDHTLTLVTQNRTPFTFFSSSSGRRVLLSGYESQTYHRRRLKYSIWDRREYGMRGVTQRSADPSSHCVRWRLS